jgi:hypothetical protein
MEKTQVFFQSDAYSSRRDVRLFAETARLVKYFECGFLYR